MINVTPAPENSAEPVNVVVAEDEVLIRVMLADGLREAGFRVWEASPTCAKSSIGSRQINGLAEKSALHFLRRISGARRDS
jgi:hypothetical protein